MAGKGTALLALLSKKPPSSSDMDDGGGDEEMSEDYADAVKEAFPDFDDDQVAAFKEAVKACMKAD